jgi:polar amino acid transport system substrate-binding protein
MLQFRHRVSLTCAVAALLFGAPAALACGPYRVGVKEYPVIYERQPGGREYRWLDKDFYALLAERSGCQFQLELESQPRVWAAMRSGQMDITGWAIPTPERHQHALMIPLLSLRPLALSWSKHEVLNAEAFIANPALRAVAVRGSSYGPEYDALLARLRTLGRLSEVGDVVVAARVFFAQRVDLLIAYPWAVAPALRDAQSAVRAADWYPQAPGMRSGLALSRRTVSEADQRLILRTLQAMQRDGSLARLIRQHLPEVGVHLQTQLALQ